MKLFKVRYLLMICLYVSCVNTSNTDSKEPIVYKTDSSIKNSSHDSVINYKSEKPCVKASAYLIYDDSTLSAFDVVNNDSVMLWNAVAGGGDVLKPSQSTKFIVTGEIDSLDIRVKKGDKVAFEKRIRGLDNKFEFVVKGIGCEKVYVNITRGNSLIINDTINFHCGE